MKILVICQYYYPEPFRISEICESLTKRGHEVQVVTGEPNYPEGQIYQGYENHQKSDDIHNGVRIHRCPIIPRKTGAIYRFLNYYSYAISASRFVRSGKCASSDGTPFDIVFVNQLSPVMMANPAIEYQKKYHVPILMYCLDLWPVSLVAGGIAQSSLLFRAFHRVSKRIYRKMDRILVTSQMFSPYLQREFAISESSLGYLPQFAETLFDRIPYKAPTSEIDLVFAGNIGTAQSVSTVLLAAKKLTKTNIHFHIVGGGIELEKLRAIAEQEQLNHVYFYGRRPLEEMPRFFEMADAMLITMQADPVLSLTLPGKMQAYLSAGKPIIGAINGEAKRVIEEARCGFCGPAEDAEELAKNILRFASSENTKELADRARQYYTEHFDADRIMNQLEAELIREKNAAANQGKGRTNSLL